MLSLFGGPGDFLLPLELYLGLKVKLVFGLLVMYFFGSNLAFLRRSS
jgi:hypothetical protein